VCWESTLDWTYGEVIVNSGIGSHSLCFSLDSVLRGGTTRTGDFKCREVKIGFFRNRSVQTGSSGTLIGWKSGQSTYVPLGRGSLWTRGETTDSMNR
jgi:hypothetical protein